MGTRLMPVFKFRGFATGETVDLSVTQGASAGSASVPAWGQGAATPITVALSATRLSGTAPMGNLFFAETASPAARVVHPYHDIESVWSFDDPGNFIALGNAPVWGTDRNLAYGPRATHVHSSPGQYVVTCTSHDGENAPRSETIAVTVNNPDTVFAGTDTAVVSQAGNFAGKPSGAAEFTSVAAAISHLAGRANARLLLRAGESFGGGVSISQTGGSGRRLYVGAFGAGAKPILNLGASQDGVRIATGASNFVEVIVEGLDIRGVYDPTATSQPTNVTSLGIDFRNCGLATHKTVWNCEISGVNMGVRLDGTNSFVTYQKNFYMGNTQIIGWLDYGVFSGDAGNWGLSGCTIQQPRGTVNSNGKASAPFYPDHNPLRISRAWDTVVISNNDWTSFNDWSANNDSRNMQPILRWNTGNGGADPELVLDRFRGEGAMLRLYNAVANDTGGGPPSTKNPAWIVADRIFHIGTAHPQNLLEAPLGGTTIRNAVIVSPNCAPGWGTGMRRFFSDGGSGAFGAGNNSRRSEVYSSAFIDLRSDDNARSRNMITLNRPFDAGGFTNISPNFFGNILFHAPNMVDGAPANDRSPLEGAARWEPVYDGERWRTEPVDTTRAYGGEVTASFAPLTGSTAIGTASGKVSLLDFDGNLRSEVLAGLARSTPSIGPYEPALEG